MDAPAAEPVLACVVADGYDRDVFERILKSDAAVGRALERAERLLMHARHLLADVFAILFKMNVELRGPRDVSPAVLLHRELLSVLLASPDLPKLRERTALDEAATAMLLAPLFERVLLAISKAWKVDARTLREIGELGEDEERLAEIFRQLDTLDGLDDSAINEDERRRLARELANEANRLSMKLDAARRAETRRAGDIADELRDVLSKDVQKLPRDLNQAAETARGLGLGSGNLDPGGAEASFALGERLLRSKKLRLLAQLTGAMRDLAARARRQRVPRAPQEMHSVSTGRHLDRLVPSEYLGLPKDTGGLHLEFLRRFAEGELLEYQLVAPATRGPMVVCVDGSGSMSGSKEIWAKAVALTLMEIARRERRACLALVFSDYQDVTTYELLDRRAISGGKGGRGRVRDEEVLKFAESFPGGGTSFEGALEHALAAVAEGRHRRGDIVFITDGEAPVSDDLLQRLEREQRRHAFRIRGILVDTDGPQGMARADTLERFCDELMKVSDLAGADLAGLFSAV